MGDPADIWLCVKRIDFKTTEAMLWKAKVDYCKDNKTTTYRYHLHGREADIAEKAPEILSRLRGLGLRAKIILSFLGVILGIHSLCDTGRNRGVSRRGV